MMERTCRDLLSSKQINKENFKMNFIKKRRINETATAFTTFDILSIYRYYFYDFY